MKKLVTISLLSLLIYNMGGFYMAFVSIQHHLKEVMHQYIESGEAQSKIIVLSFDYIDGRINDKNFEYQDDEREFTWFDSRYDIVKKEVKGNHINIYCISDKEETLLMSLLGEQEKTNYGDANHPRKNPLTLLKIFQCDYTNTNRISINHNIIYFEHKYCGMKTVTYQNIFLNKFSPPPEV